MPTIRRGDGLLSGLRFLGRSFSKGPERSKHPVMEVIHRLEDPFSKVTLRSAWTIGMRLREESYSWF